MQDVWGAGLKPGSYIGRVHIVEGRASWGAAVLRPYMDLALLSWAGGVILEVAANPRWVGRIALLSFL